MSAPVVAVLHPGEMGVTVAAAARGRAAEVRFASAGRSAATRARAEEAGLRDAGSLAACLRGVDLVLSVCPPHAALAMAEEVAAAGFRGTYADLNAIAPETARRVAACVASAGALAVDGGLVGPPARRPGTTTLYLSGAGAEEVAALFADSTLEALVLPGPVGRASALKMAFASWTKGSAALLAATAAAARAHGVEEALGELWGRRLPELPGRLDAGTRAVAPKAWRFEGEMREIEATFAAAGLPGGFHAAAAELYRRLAGSGAAGEGTGSPSLGELLDRLRRDGG